MKGEEPQNLPSPLRSSSPQSGGPWPKTLGELISPLGASQMTCPVDIQSNNRPEVSNFQGRLPPTSNPGQGRKFTPTHADSQTSGLCFLQATNLLRALLRQGSSFRFLVSVPVLEGTLSGLSPWGF